MGKLVVLDVTAEQESAISDMFIDKEWKFINLRKFLSEKLEDEILSAWKQSMEGLTDAWTGEKRKTQAISPTQEDQPIHGGSATEINLDKNTVRNDKVVTRKKKSKPLINQGKPLNLRSKKYDSNLEQRTNSKGKGTGSQQISFTTEENVEQTEHMLQPESKNKNGRNAEVVRAKSDHVMEENECFDEGNISGNPDIKFGNCLAVIEQEKAPLVNENDNCLSRNCKDSKPKIKWKGLTQKDLKCEECSYRTNVRSNLNRHIKEIHSGVRHKCSKCTKTFKGKHDAKMHQLYSHTSGFQCKQCDKIFSSISGLRNHVKIIHKKRSLYKCDHCDMKFYYKSHYLGHLNKHLDLKPFSCKTCQKPFRYKIACHLHEKTCCHDNYYVTHNSDGSLKEVNKSKFLCDICGKEVSSKSSLKTHHYYTHSKDTTTVCSQCGKSFKGQYSLQRHVKNAHEDTGVRYTCPDCKKEFSQQQIFKQHLKIHQKAYTCTCETCGKGFLSKFKLLEHSRIHTGEKPFTCPHCHIFKSATKTNLQKHMRIHEEGRLPRQQSKKKKSKQKSTLAPDKKTNFHGKSVCEVNSVDSSIKHFETLIEPMYVSLEMSTGSYIGTSEFIEGESQYTNLQKVSMNDNSAKFVTQSYRHVYIGDDNASQGQGHINFTMRNEQDNDGEIHSRFDTRNIQKSEFDNEQLSERKSEMKVDSQIDYELNANGDSYYGSNSREATELSQGLNILTVAMNIVNPSQY